MKKSFLLLIILIAIIACKKEISGSSILKDIPDSFFTIDNQHQGVKITQERLPNNEFSKFHLKDNPDIYGNYFNVTLNLKKGDSITFEGTDIEKEELIPVVADFIDFAAQGKTTMLHLNFDENLSLKHYLDFKQHVDNITNESIIINPKVFIYDLKALPDCDCSL